MFFCCHRINTVAELAAINHSYGVEIDLRDAPDGSICLAHDPFVGSGTTGLEDFLQAYRHAFLILNIKSEGIEYKVLELLEKYNISRYFFLDCSFPMIHRLTAKGVRNIAVRFSEYESAETVLAIADKIDWVWVDCFTRNPLDRAIYDRFKAAGLRICFVSPELHGYGLPKIIEYRDSFVREGIEPDMICTKAHNIRYWRTHRPVQIVIPMSGVGKRFQEAGYLVPKPLIEVDDRPMIEHVVGLFPDEPIVHFICNARHLDVGGGGAMRETLQRICPWGSIHKVPDEDRQGPVHAVAQIYDAIEDDLEVIVSYCDYGTYWNYDDFLRDTRERGADGAIACYRGFHPHMLGTDNYAFLREDGVGTRWMSAIQEKRPFTADRMSEYASNGTYYFKSGAIMKRFFTELMSRGLRVNGEYYVSMVYNLMVEAGKSPSILGRWLSPLSWRRVRAPPPLRVSIYEIQHMLQWGTPYDLEIYRDWSRYFANLITPRPEFVDRLGTTLILPMAGAGSRFATKGYHAPKPLLDVDGAPMILQAVDCLPRTSKKVFICQKEHIETHAVDKVLCAHYGQDTTQVFAIEGVTEGQACTCELGMNLAGVDPESPILISACDNGVVYDVAAYQALVDDPTVDVIVWSFRDNPTSRNHPNMYAWMETDAGGAVRSVSCKQFDPARHDIKTSHVIIGTMFFRKARYFVEGLHANYREGIRSNGEFYVDDVLNQSIKAGLRVRVFEVENYICWGTPEDYETYQYWREFFDKCGWHAYRKNTLRGKST